MTPATPWSDDFRTPLPDDLDRANRVIPGAHLISGRGFELPRGRAGRVRPEGARAEALPSKLAIEAARRDLTTLGLSGAGLRLLERDASLLLVAMENGPHAAAAAWKRFLATVADLLDLALGMNPDATDLSLPQTNAAARLVALASGSRR